MARPPKINEAASADVTASESITYLPQDGDPPKVKWGGRTFHANVAVMVSNPILIAKAKVNNWFHVGAGAPKVAVEDDGAPKTAEQYRGHVAKWLKTMTDVDELDARWTAEESLRMDCGIGSEDLDLLGALIDPLRSELLKAKIDDAA